MNAFTRWRRPQDKNKFKRIFKWIWYIFTSPAIFFDPITQKDLDWLKKRKNNKKAPF